MRKGAKTLNDERYLRLFPFAVVMHIPYLIIFAILGQFKRFRWAEETAESAVQKKIAEEVV